MTEYTAWHSWIVIPLWVARMVISARYVTYGFVALSFGLEQPSVIEVPLHFFTLCQIVCFGLESVEISRYKLKTLDPYFYLLTQLLKSVIYTLDVLYKIWLRGSDDLLSEDRYSPDIIIFYIGFVYALYVFVRQRRTRPTVSTKWLGLVSNGSRESHPSSEIVLPPQSINSSQSIRADSVIIVQVLQWLNLGERDGREQQSLLRTCFYWACLSTKYAICYFVCLIVLPFSSQIPGEPHHPKLIGPYPLFNQWNYLKQEMKHEDVEDVDITTSTRSLGSRASVTELDSKFQALAKLSLASNSDQILERLMCLRDSMLSWNDPEDFWSARPWHLIPLYHIANVGQDDTLLIEDAMGTAIDWQSLKLVDFKLVSTPSTFAWRLYRQSCLFCFIFFMTYLYTGYQLAPALSAFYEDDEIATEIRNNMWTYTVVVCIIGAIASIPTPYMISRHFRHQFSDTQARMFGLEGKPDLDAIESHTFGFSCGRLRWNSQDADNIMETDSRPQYTLIDTASCTATVFHASKPPAMAFAGGREGGLLRMLLCSYNENRNVFVKETVVQMPDIVLKRLPHLDGFDLAITSASYKDKDDV